MFLIDEVVFLFIWKDYIIFVIVVFFVFMVMDYGLDLIIYYDMYLKFEI